MTHNGTLAHQPPTEAAIPAESDAIVFLPIEEVGRRIGVSRRTIYNLIKNSAEFPKPVEISDRRVGFVESEIAAWQRRKIEARQYA